MFLYNCYRHWGKVFVRDEPGKLAIIIQSKEEITQGCVQSINACGISTLTLEHDTRAAIPQTLQPWFAHDAGAVDKAKHSTECLEYLVIHGPLFGYYPEPSKSWYICKAEDKTVARQAFEERGLHIKYTQSQKYLGRFIGSADTKEDWLNKKVADWLEAVKTLAKTAVQYP